MRTLLLAIAASMLLCGVAQAETLDVCPKGCTYSSIQDAIDTSSDGDEILVGPGTYTSTQDGHVVDLKGKAVTLRSSDGSDVTIIDGQDARRGIACYQGETEATVIEGFTITNGYGVDYDYNGNDYSDSWERDGGGMLNYESSPRLTNCTLTGNSTDENGGGMEIRSNSYPTLINCTFSNNTANYGGGGIHNSNTCYPTLFNCTFTGNSANAYGGGMWIRHCNISPTLTYCTFSNNTASSGGGLSNTGGSSPTFVNCTFSNNTASGSGGGMYSSSISSPTLTDCSFQSNTADYGGGMHNSQSSPTLNSCTFAGNAVESNLGGGGIYNNNGSSPTLTNCEFTGNSGNKYGGGIYNYSGSSILIECSFTGNIADVSGGGLYNMYSSPSLTNCLFTGNTATTSGGGLYNNNDSNPTLTDTIICGNDPDQVAPEGSFTDNGGNTIADECPADCDGDITGDGHVDVDDLLEVIAGWGECESDVIRSPLGSILDRNRPTDLRIMTWNVKHFRPADDTEEELAPFIRVLRALDADVIVFNEIERDSDVKALPGWLDDHVRSGTWQVHEGIGTGHRTVIASYYPMDMLETNTIPPVIPKGWIGRGVTMALVDCPDVHWSTDLYLLGVHLKAGTDEGDEEERQESADAIANWLGDLRTAGEEIDLPQNTPMVVLGDVNFYDEGDQPELTLLTGDIQNEDYYGPDIKGDWDNSDLVDPMPVDPITGDTWTIWDWKSRPDRYMVTDSVVDIRNTFILNTTELPREELNANGLEGEDTTEYATSDHLPVVVDFRGPYFCQADLNDDGTVDVNDLLLVIGGWGPCP